MQGLLTKLQWWFINFHYFIPITAVLPFLLTTLDTKGYTGIYIWKKCHFCHKLIDIYCSEQHNQIKHNIIYSEENLQSSYWQTGNKRKLWEKIIFSTWALFLNISTSYLHQKLWGIEIMVWRISLLITYFYFPRERFVRWKAQNV